MPVSCDVRQAANDDENSGERQKQDEFTQGRITRSTPTLHRDSNMRVRERKRLVRLVDPLDNPLQTPCLEKSVKTVDGEGSDDAGNQQHERGGGG